MEQPSGVISIRIDPSTGKRTSANDVNAMFEYFMLPFVPDKESSTDTVAADSGEKPAEGLY